MTPEQKSTLDYIDSLRKDYAAARSMGDDLRMTAIIEQIEQLTEVHKLIKCHLESCKRLMFPDPHDPNFPFHSAVCHKTWADANYPPPKRRTWDEDVANAAKEKWLPKNEQAKLL